MTDYTAPARFSLTVVHIRNPEKSGKTAMPGQDATAGETICGRPMLNAELWQLLDLEPSDVVCAACLDPAAAGAEQQGMLL